MGPLDGRQRAYCRVKNGKDNGGALLNRFIPWLGLAGLAIITPAILFSVDRDLGGPSWSPDVALPSFGNNDSSSRAPRNSPETEEAPQSRTEQESSNGNSPRLRASVHKEITAAHPLLSHSSHASSGGQAFYKLTFDGLWEHYDCDDYFSHPQARPVNHSPIWQRMREVYSKVIQPQPELQHRLLHEETTMQVPYSVRRVAGKGLGLFAEADIEQGSVVYDGDHGGHVMFGSGRDFHDFLWNLSQRYPAQNMGRNMACLALQCSAVESTTSETKRPRDGAHIALDMDDGCFANTANTEEEQNVGGSSQMRDYALRSIRKNEELVWSYGDYVFSWKWFNM